MIVYIVCRFLVFACIGVCEVRETSTKFDENANVVLVICLTLFGKSVLHSDSSLFK